MMAVERLQPAELTEQRAELKAVLESRGFTRAPTLANLLAYLCEKMFAGESSQIKEYSIGVEVFHRGPDFDQETDSIVRVEANRLRRRLSEFYEHDGAQHSLRIVIPVGQYVPKFERTLAPAVAERDVQPATAEREVQPEIARDVQSTTQPTTQPTTTTRTSRFVSPRASPHWWWIAAAGAILLVCAGYFWQHSRHERQLQVTEAPNPVEQDEETSVGPPAGEEIRILAGANRSFVDHAGKLWNADHWFTGGTAVKSTARQIWRTQDSDFYRTSRQGQFRYDIPLKKGIYELRLHFAETVYGSESNETGGEGSRLMNVRANGRQLLTDFDVVADAGGSDTADVKVFPGMTPAADGMLHLEFSADKGQQAMLSAIEILPGMRERMRPLRVLTRQTPYYSNDSHWWSPDNYFQGGQLASYTTPVSGTDDPELFETERWGNFTYALPVPPGRYTLTLYFAVRRGDWDEPLPSVLEERPRVAHVFNVFCNGKVLLSNFNLPREVGKTDTVTRRFNGLESNAQGKLLLSFVPVEGYATVTGIEVLPE
jgi:hypothetical protein